MSDRATTLRQQITENIAAAQWAHARAALVEFWELTPSPAVAPFVVSRFEKLRGHVSLTACRVGILRSFTVEPLVALTRAMGFVGGIDLELRLGEFNTYSQEILNPASWIYATELHAVILAVQTRDLSPELWENFADLSPAQVEQAIVDVSRQFELLVNTFRERSAAHLIIHTLAAPAVTAMGVYDSQGNAGQSATIARVNHRLAEIAARHANVHLLDYAGLIARRGYAQFEDLSKWLTVRLPIAADQLIHVSREWLRYLHPISGRVCKCVVVDLDNTLWGGVIGEDGIDGIKLGPDKEGFGYWQLQRALLDLYRRGIILAIASKNNERDARAALEQHAGMMLKPEHFSATRINWNDKATSLREIAAELNIGLDSLAFVDDNPFERQWVRKEIPELTVIDLPEDPLKYAGALREAAVFERLSITDEDRQRGRMYAEQRVRKELQSSAGSLEDYYRSLEMRVEIVPLTAANLSRIAQLTQKTNQFNLTTRRYSEQQMNELAARPGWQAMGVTVKDKMGDNGLVGVVITKDDGQLREIDTFLLSCRVIGRTIETAILAHLAANARDQGMKQLGGWFIPTAKNAPAKDFYDAHRFKQSRQTEISTWWEFDLTAAQSLIVPPWIDLVTTGNNAT